MKQAPLSDAIGRNVTLHTQNGRIDGTGLPSPQADLFIVKRADGYNMAIPIAEIQQWEIQKENPPPTAPIAPGTPFGPSTGPKITIIHTGGTIASRVDYRTGAVTAAFKTSDLLAMYPDLATKAELNAIHVGNMWSGDMRLGHFQKIARAIANIAQHNDARGVIVTHGTDTMAYSAAANAFMLENIPFPVVFVGAQRSSDRGSSDAANNLAGAIAFITQTDYRGVAIAMNAESTNELVGIFSPTRTRKMHSSKRSAFKTIGEPPLAKIAPASGQILETHLPQPNADPRAFALRDALEEKTGMLYVYPGLTPEHIAFYREHHYRGLVLVGTGLGHLPVHTLDAESALNERNLAEIRQLVDSGCIVAMTSQCIHGRVNMNVYSYGRDLLAAGVIGGEDMLPETAFVKLAWLLGNYPRDEAKKRLTQNLAGEITERSTLEPDDA